DGTRASPTWWHGAASTNPRSATGPPTTFCEPDMTTQAILERPSETRKTTFDTAAARKRCLGYRRRILEVSQQVTALHVAPAFSCTEIVDVIYHGLMRWPAKNRSPDVFLMSKGHGCLVQYVILEEM